MSRKEKPPLEIERKFLVRELPADLTSYPSTDLSQGYLVSLDDGLQVRLRKADDKFSLTFKRGSGNVREEREIELSADQFDALWPATAGKRLVKTRYEIPFRDRVVEIDLYHGTHEGLVVAEVEFDDEESAKTFQPPDWLGADVTGDPRYSNQLLAS
ncbi:MAG TPA: CYTH domain-containing protein [Chthoniobacterales bacterium]|jgi:CYTH domain-containing protein|nr:CYTH domain-containing protein [Chthoniobacterales bacterium]